MQRRSFVRVLLGGTALAGLAGCVNGQLQLPVTLPTNVQTLLNDANDIINKVESLGTAVGTEITTLEGQAQGLITSISGGGDVVGLGTSLLSIFASIAGLLPPPYGTIASAILTLIPTIASLVPGMSAPAPTANMRPRIAMTVDQAWQVIRSR